VVAIGLLQVGCDSAGFSLQRPDPVGAYQLFIEVQGGDDNAMKKLIQKASKRDPYAQMQVGYILQTGAGRYKVDIQQAMDYYLRCSGVLQNCDFNMGLIYLNGLHETPPKPNAVKAVVYFKKAAGPQQNKHLQAAMQLGNIYEHGFGEVAQDYGQAISWYMAAANQNDPVAQLRIGLIKMSGADGTRDVASARDYLMKAAGQYHFDAQFYLAKLLTEDFGDVEQAARWLVVAAVRSPAHKSYAEEFLLRLPEKKRIQAEAGGRQWANSHRPPRPVDYNSPRNKDANR
jgi:hypothetical protein